MTAGCYEDVDGLRCPNPAVYEAKLHSNTAPKWLICVEHAAVFRADDDVEWIKTLEAVG